MKIVFIELLLAIFIVFGLWVVHYYFDILGFLVSITLMCVGLLAYQTTRLEKLHKEKRN